MSKTEAIILKQLYSKTDLSQIVEDITYKLNNDSIVHINGLESSSKNFFSSFFSYKSKEKTLIITKDEKEAEKAQKEISYFIDAEVPYLPRKQPDADKPLFSSKSDVFSQRSNWLHQAENSNMLICDAQTLIERFIPNDFYKQNRVKIKVKDNLERSLLQNNLIRFGFIKTDFVQKTGEYSRRGSIVDIFSPSYSLPLRIEFFGDSVQSIRFFSTANQKTISKTDEITIIPTTELIINSGNIDFIKSSVKRFSNENGVSASYRNSLLQQLESGKRPDYANWLMPFCCKSLDCIFDYIAQNTILIFYNSEDDQYFERCLENISYKLELLRKKFKIIPDTDSLYLNRPELNKKLLRFRKIYIADLPLNKKNTFNLEFKNINFSKHAENLIENRPENNTGNQDSPYDELLNNLKQLLAEDYLIFFVLKTTNEINKLKEITQSRNLRNIQFDMGDIGSGFISDKSKIVLITENEIYKERKIKKDIKSDDTPSAFITSFSELKPGDYVVHKEFGIGLYKGLLQLDIKNKKADFLVCEYRDGDKIYVPVDKLNIVQRYIGDGKSPVIEKLGKETWSKTLRKVKKSIELIAKDLLQLYARRKAEKGFRFSKNDELYNELESSFEHDETSHQISAINDVMTDMESQNSMDRLICGDVGFGKTEVAIRAAFKAVMDAKQVAVIVPTTLLCFQHYLTFRSRLKDFAVNIEMISRFRTSAQTTKILKSLSEGKTDIIIGTHKLLGNKVNFKDLGLIIIDEEHKFGVKQKENIRKMKSSVDVLALSATPIPRTLQLSLVNIRDISLINTPPEGRQQIETYVYHYNENTIKNAISNELKRGGSVFFIHNRIENIHGVAERISKIVPDAKYEITHGRMNESMLEKSIGKFINGEINLLITTTIVESGLDIPRANTIIINDAHTFGLADLYQLRGRVGRTDKKAYAYFLIPQSKQLTEASKKRLKAISELKELGSGFKLALSDLEIRGAGTLFGTEQSGHIGNIGLEMYLEILESAIKDLSHQKKEFDFEPEIKSSHPTFIPNEYIEDDSERLMVYKKLSSVKTFKELREIYSDISDRFGKVPEAVNNLFSLIEIKIYMKKFFIKKLDLKQKSVAMEFLENSPLFDYFRPSGIYKLHDSKDFDLKSIKKIMSSFTAGKPPYMNQIKEPSLH
ncbi:MAG: transcription-repair coupling factor [Deltaproteobacteria bacterium]|nr:MAG: transcription-repair coupling factor [Deltaproteobacteria bacterium]